jgi:hypothetical protein
VVTGVNCVGLVDIGLKGSSNPAASGCEMGELTVAEDAMVQLTPLRELGGVTLSGAFRVIEQTVGSTAADGVIRAGLCGEPMAMTKGMLEVDAVFSLRSGGGEDRTG